MQSTHNSQDNIIAILIFTSVYDVLLWRTEILTEGFPLLFGAPFSIVNCLVINQSINLFASDHMDPYHNKRKYNEMIK